MRYLIRVFVALVTFALGSAIAGLIAPATKTPPNRWQHRCCRASAAPAPAQSERIDPRWVLVPRDIAWRGEMIPYQADHGPETKQVADSEIAIFYPSGKFAYVIGQLEQIHGSDPRVQFAPDSGYGYRIYLGTWTWKENGTIEIVAEASFGKSGIVDRHIQTNLHWTGIPTDGEPQDQDWLNLDGKVFAHRSDFRSLLLLSELISRAPVAQVPPTVVVRL